MNVFRVISKLSTILSTHQKFRIMEIFIFMIFGGILETLSVSLILPFMNVVLNPDVAMKNTIVERICVVFGISSARMFLVFVAVAFAFIYLLKNIYLLLEYNIQYKFVFNNMFEMKKRLLKSFLGRPYEFFLGINSAEILRIVNNDTEKAFNVLTTVLLLFTEVVVSCMLMMAVFIITPGISVGISVFLVAVMLIISQILKPILQNAGMDYQKSLTGMNKWLLQSVQGIKEVKIQRKEHFFEDKYNSFGKKFTNSLRIKNVLGVAPRFFVEASGMCMLFFMIAVLIYSGVDLDKIIPTLSAVAIASMRLLPSINRISSGISSLSYEEPMLDKLIETLHDVEKLEMEEETKHGKEDTINSITYFLDTISADGILYCYPNTETPVLKEANISINRGSCVGIIGASGAGKTTIVDIILGLLEPQSGSVLVDGINISNDKSGWLMHIGYIPQMIFMLDDTIRANVAFGESEVSDEEVWRALSEAQLEGFVNSLPNGLDTEIGERGVRLSGGQRQRIGIARALYPNPEILIFDEATSALDNETENEVMKSINALLGERTIIIIAHRLTTIEKCDHVYRVENGKIFKER